jgi:hypothetical protein
MLQLDREMQLSGWWTHYVVIGPLGLQRIPATFSPVVMMYERDI